MTLEEVVFFLSSDADAVVVALLLLEGFFLGVLPSVLVEFVIRLLALVVWTVLAKPVLLLLAALTGEVCVLLLPKSGLLANNSLTD